MPDIGRQVLSTQIGHDLMVLFNFKGVRWDAAGLTIDWDTVDAVTSDNVLIDSTKVLDGQKALRYGQVLTKITASGKYGPYDSTANDGRQTLTRGDCYVLNQTVIENGTLPGLTAVASNQIGGVFDVGTVWKARLIIGAQTNDLGGPNGPSEANFNTAFPGIRYAQ